MIRPRLNRHDLAAIEAQQAIRQDRAMSLSALIAAAITGGIAIALLTGLL